MGTHTQKEKSINEKEIKSQSPHKVVKNSRLFIRRHGNNSKYLNNRKTLHLDVIYSAADGLVVVERGTCRRKKDE